MLRGGLRIRVRVLLREGRKGEGGKEGRGLLGGAWSCIVVVVFEKGFLCLALAFTSSVYINIFYLQQSWLYCIVLRYMLTSVCFTDIILYRYTTYSFKRQNNYFHDRINSSTYLPN